MGVGRPRGSRRVDRAVAPRTRSPGTGSNVWHHTACLRSAERRMAHHLDRPGAAGLRSNDRTQGRRRHRSGVSQPAGGPMPVAIHGDCVRFVSLDLARFYGRRRELESACRVPLAAPIDHLSGRRSRVGLWPGFCIHCYVRISAAELSGLNRRVYISAQSGCSHGAGTRSASCP